MWFLFSCFLFFFQKRKRKSSFILFYSVSLCFIVFHVFIFIINFFMFHFAASIFAFQKAAKTQITSTNVGQIRPHTDLDRPSPSTPKNESFEASEAHPTNSCCAPQVRLGQEMWFRLPCGFKVPMTTIRVKMQILPHDVLVSLAQESHPGEPRRTQGNRGTQESPGVLRGAEPRRAQESHVLWCGRPLFIVQAMRVSVMLWCGCHVLWSGSFHCASFLFLFIFHVFHVHPFLQPCLMFSFSFFTKLSVTKVVEIKPGTDLDRSLSPFTLRPPKKKLISGSIRSSRSKRQLLLCTGHDRSGQDTTCGFDNLISLLRKSKCVFN